MRKITLKTECVYYAIEGLEFNDDVTTEEIKEFICEHNLPPLEEPSENTLKVTIIKDSKGEIKNEIL